MFFSFDRTGIIGYRCPVVPGTRRVSEVETLRVLRGDKITLENRIVASMEGNPKCVHPFGHSRLESRRSETDFLGVRIVEDIGQQPISLEAVAFLAGGHNIQPRVLTFKGAGNDVIYRVGLALAITATRAVHQGVPSENRSPAKRRTNLEWDISKRQKTDHLWNDQGKPLGSDDFISLFENFSFVLQHKNDRALPGDGAYRFV